MPLIRMEGNMLRPCRERKAPTWESLMLHVVNEQRIRMINNYVCIIEQTCQSSPINKKNDKSTTHKKILKPQ